ncbi:MAG: XRE family transcriptional regulator [Acidobacteria bacterium]|nr:XRE family transcriptional regulator [Acidobacteriota bacterium]
MLSIALNRSCKPPPGGGLGARTLQQRRSPGRLPVCYIADLGYARPEEAAAKAELAHKITKIIERRKLTQAEAASLLEVDQPKVSALTWPPQVPRSTVASTAGCTPRQPTHVAREQRRRVDESPVHDGRSRCTSLRIATARVSAARMIEASRAVASDAS